MLSEIYSDDCDLRCCGNCVYLAGLCCDQLKTVVVPSACCDYYECDEQSFKDRVKLLVKKES